MKGLCYGLLIFLCAGVAYGNECKSYCDDAFKAAGEQNQVVCQKASEIGRTCMILEGQGAAAIGAKLQDTYPEYTEAQKLVGIARYLYDLTGAFEAADVEVPGYTYETAARVVTAAKDKLEAVEAKLDALAEELRGLLDREA